MRASNLLAKLHRLYHVPCLDWSASAYFTYTMQDSMVWIRARVGITKLQEIHEPASTCFSLRSFHFMPVVWIFINGLCWFVTQILGSRLRSYRDNGIHSSWSNALDPKLRVLTGINSLSLWKSRCTTLASRATSFVFSPCARWAMGIHRVCGAWVNDIVKRHHDITSYLMLSISPTQLPPRIRTLGMIASGTSWLTAWQ